MAEYMGGRGPFQDSIEEGAVTTTRVGEITFTAKYCISGFEYRLLNVPGRREVYSIPLARKVYIVFYFHGESTFMVAKISCVIEAMGSA